MDDTARIIARRKRQDRVFNVLGILCTSVGLVTLSALLVDLAIDGLSRIDWAFLTSFPSRRAAQAGILSAWVGSLAIMFVTACTAVPLGVAAGVYLEEYGKKNWLTLIIEVNISNLAGVPSIIYGLMALGLFVYMLGLGHSVLAGGLTLAVLILPIVIVATREALRTIPVHIREAAYALGATKWQVVRHHLLPYSVGGIATGVIIALSRAIGETAPLITIGALSFIAFLPASPISAEAPFVSFEWLDSPFMVLPIQMFNWTSRPTQDFHVNAAAAGLVLIVMTLGLNAVAIFVRYRARRKIKW
jgi:phosphate transport system permease protein